MISAPDAFLKRIGPDSRNGIEWPTALITVIIYGGWLALTWWHGVLPMPLIVVIGAWLIAWHGSLQHETIHGHPTGSRRINAAIGFVPLALWLPYAHYARSHEAHHASDWITHPARDPESRYLAGDGSLWALLARAQATLVGRLVFGPIVAVAALAHEELGRVRQTPAAVLKDWLPHLAAVAVIAGWLEWTGFGVVRYLLLVVYPGTALTLLRSFAEHRADLPDGARAATVERGGVLGLLFLNNNLHAAHHERPDLAWFRLPAYQRDHRQRLSAGSASTYRDYGEIVRRFAFRPHHVLIHPGEEARS
jgi:fatty acid desaturase